MSTKYPKEIYCNDYVIGECLAAERAYDIGKTHASRNIEEISSLESVLADIEYFDHGYLPAVRGIVERAYRAGLTDADKSNDLTGWSNLTEAIQTEEPIDWEKLDGLETQCVHPEMGTLTYTMKRNQHELASTIYGWNTRESIVWEWAFELAWKAEHGWTLYIKGEIPLKPVTADTLPNGMCFDGSHPTFGKAKMVIIEDPENSDEKLVFPLVFAPSKKPEEITVLKTYGIGTFKEQSGEA